MQRLTFAMLALLLAFVPTYAQSIGATFKLVDTRVASGTPQKIHVVVTDASGKPLTVLNLKVRVDMGPDAMADMVADAKVTQTGGQIIVETNLYAPGRWAIILSGTINGKPLKSNLIVTAQKKSAEAASPPPANPKARKILYYRNPMGLADRSSIPKKDSMGMDYIPVFSDELVATPGAVRLTNEKIQRAGVHTTAVTRMVLSKEVRAAGTISADETTQAVLTARFTGFVEKLYISQTGDIVRAGQPLMQVWVESPELLIKSADYIGALQSDSPDHAAAAAALLRQYGVSQAALTAMAKSGVPTRTLTIVAPASGTVMEKPAVKGMHFATGDTLFRTTDLSRVWVLADVSERDLPFVKRGSHASVAFRDNPSQSFDGVVLMIYPQIDQITRTAKVRIAVSNRNGQFRIGQYADVRIASGRGNASSLVVPASAIIDDGSRQIVFVAKSGGVFEPRKLKLGVRSVEYVEVISGLSEGELVVSSGNFLIDSESNLQSALKGLGGRL